ncbi:MAG: ABC transporter permease subunit [Puniceicoccales bacterium]|jgi:microcin C transport system permease protein|nr:ABC transporter permease subunit [Puniceicoccales bacterium]
MRRLLHFKLNPNTRRKLLRFRSIQRGYFSFLILAFFVVLALFGPWLVNNRALIVSHGGKWYFPTLGADISGKTFGLDYDYETDYRALKEYFENTEKHKTAGDWVLLPPVPFNGREVCDVFGNLEWREAEKKYFLKGEVFAEGKAYLLHPNGRFRREWSVLGGKLHGPFCGYDIHGSLTERGRWEHGTLARYEKLSAQTEGTGAAAAAGTTGMAGAATAGVTTVGVGGFSEPLLHNLRCFLPYPNAPLTSGHLLGTDESGHDVLARLFYGFRILCVASLIYLTLTYLVGISIGCAMGYFGGWFDIIAQRLIEVWSNIPYLYLIIFLSSVLIPNLFGLMIIIVAFSWITLTYYMRTGTYREKERDYIAAARLLGAGNARIIFRHILPNTLSTVVTFVPFMVAAVVFQLTALDFLGFGLPPTEPTWGEMLRQGTENFESPWILASVVTCLVVLLVLITFVGEAVREAFDPKKFTTYQ